MGKFDGVMKFLGKEDSYSPEQIKKGIESQERMDNLSDLTNVPQENMDNIERLINGSAFGDSTNAAAPQQTGGAPSVETAPPADNTQVDPEVLKEFENLDQPAPKVDELKNLLKVTSYDMPHEELDQMEQNEEFAAAGEEAAEEESADNVNIFEPQFKNIPSEEEPVEAESTGFSETPAEFEGTPDFDLAAHAEASEIPPSAAGEGDMADLFKQFSASEEPSPLPESLPDFALNDELPAPQESKPEEESLPAMEEFPQMEQPAFEPETGGGEMELPEMTDFGAIEEPVSTETTSLPIEEPHDSFEMPEFEAPSHEETPESVPAMDFETATEAARTEFSDIEDHIKTFEKPKPFAAPDILKSKKAPQAAFGMEIDQDKALKIRNKINQLSDSLLRKKVRHAIMETKLPDDILQQLVAMLLLNEQEDDIRNFVNNYVPDETISDMEQEEIRQTSQAPRTPGGKRKVIYTEETKRAKEFQGDVKNFTRYSFVAFIIVILLGILFVRVIYAPTISNRYYQRGMADMNRGDYRSAEMNFETGKSKGGPSLKWYNLYASNYIVLLQYDAAKKKYIEALNYDPLDRDTIYHFASFYKKQVYPPRYDEALKLYNRLMKKSPDTFEYLDKAGTTYIEWGDRTSDPLEQTKLYDDAANIYKNYLSKKPKHTDSYFRLLDITLRQKQEKQIDDLYDAIDRINPKAVNVLTMTELVKFYTDKKRLDRSKLVLNKLIAANPTYDESFYEYARYLTLNYDFPNAIKSISRAIQLNPKSGKSYNLLGEIYFAYDSLPNNKVLAKEQFENAIKFSPNFYKPYANLGHIYFYESLNFPDPEHALSEAYNNYKLAKQLMDKDAKDPLLSYNLGWLNYQYKFYEDAFNDFSDVYIDDPHNPILSYNLGNVYFHINKFRLALTEYDKAIEYYQALADKIGYINPELDRHKEIFGQLARSYNNRGVVYAQLWKQFKNTEYEKRALLDFYKAKDNASKINSIYNFSEYNIKFVLNKGIKARQAALDGELQKRTSLKKLAEEFKNNLINSL